MSSLDYNINMKEILTYKTSKGKCPFDEWFYKLDKTTQARIEKRLERVEEGNYGDFKKLNNDISELRFTFRLSNLLYRSQQYHCHLIMCR